MKVSSTFRLLGLSLMAGLSGCAAFQQAPQTCEEAGEACVRFTVLHTNDHHGRFWPNRYGEYGMAARKTLIDRIRAEVTAEGGQVLLFSGGDINTGVPESDLQDAEPDFQGMNLLGYDAMAVGNHEFDNPLAVLEQQQLWAEFPMLSANVYHRDGTTRYFEPYKVFEVGGLKLAVVGMTTEDTARIGNPEYVKTLRFTDPRNEIRTVLAELGSEPDVDLVFALTHMGHYQDGRHGSNAPGDVLMARSLAPGQLDVIIGGHSQNPVCMEPGSNAYAAFEPGDACQPDRQNGTWIMQAYEWGKYVGRADFEYFDGQLHLASYQLLPVNLTRKNAEGEREWAADVIPQDAQTEALLAPYQARGQSQLDEVISATDGILMGERDVVRGQVTNLGKLIAAAHSNGAVQADFGIINSGGIRASIEAGKVTYRDVLTVQPFGNDVTLTTMTGRELKQYLASVATQTRGSGGYPHFNGIEMVVDCQAQQVEIERIGGRSFDPDARYRFTLPGYNAAGGNGYPKLEQAVSTGFLDADLLYQYFKAHPHIEVGTLAPAGEVRFTGASTPYGCDAE
ncbi:bifunctional UDP-sugar hydrolase/5'-nucleotidase UshA [Marinobacter hydrocarbonoclasticus]|nr:bifunctional UDP-sugar hydrolase/5'-nucleotidase UshA [Marinobacter nauticus]